MEVGGKPIRAFTDGAASGNPGPGGWGAIVATGDGDVFELGGGEPHTTNNRMEMTAVIETLLVLTNAERPIVVHTDSTYTVHGITRWIHGWRRRGWLKADKQPVLNKDLWLKLEAAAKGLDIRWEIIAGHMGIPGNERADRIAVGYSKGRHVELYAGPEEGYPVELDRVKPTGPKPTKSKRRKKGPAYAYLSLVGGEWQRHKTWRECEARVKGVSGARFKGVESEAEFADVLRGWGVS